MWLVMVYKPLSRGRRLAPGRRIYAVGDVHGHRAKLGQVHDWIRSDLQRRPCPSPLLIHLGDLIDRGPDSAGCVALLAAGPPIPGVATTTLMGNHEAMMLAALDDGPGEAAGLWLDNGGAESLRSWGLSSTAKPREWLGAIPARHLAFLRGLRTCCAEQDYVFVHAGVRPGIPLREQSEEDLLWIRGGFLDWDGVMLPETPGRMIVHGHTPAPAPEVRSNRIALDTGAGHGGPLTCAVLERDEVSVFQA